MATSSSSSPTDSLVTFYWEKENEILFPIQECVIQNLPQNSIIPLECSEDNRVRDWGIKYIAFHDLMDIFD
ncbi:hypothetical protein CJF30_00011035 [Rutstroemia sp. NJR-2017a BBW]|nr:hypothetical protein CJF30_00011035 [Rutstroemia sp. NJR-2017a BBW]